jgi:hypothetical protein
VNHSIEFLVVISSADVVKRSRTPDGNLEKRSMAPSANWLIVQSGKRRGVTQPLLSSSKPRAPTTSITQSLIEYVNIFSAFLMRAQYSFCLSYSFRDPIFFNVVAIELPAKSRIVSQGEIAIFKLWAICNNVMPNWIALWVKVLEICPVRN